MSELYHYGIKGQRWGIRRFQNEDGTLTAEGKKRYGLEGLDSKNKDFDSRSAVKAYKKEAKQRYSKIRRTKDDMDTYLLSQDRMNHDIIEANKNKEFVSDWKKAAKRFYNAHSGKTNEDWLDAEEASIKELKKKYPQFKELISGFAPHEAIRTKEHLDEIMNMKPSTKINKYDNGELEIATNNPIFALLNNDFYYENTQKDYDNSAKVTNKAYEELNKYFIDKYGSEVIAEGNKQSKNAEKAIKIGVATVPVLLTGGIAALVISDLYK